MFLILLFAASILFSVGGIFMKYSAGLTNPLPSLGVFACFCLGAACQTLAMRRAEMSVVYIFVLGLEAITAFALSVGVLNERVTPAKVIALLLIVSGIALLNRA